MNKNTVYLRSYKKSYRTIVKISLKLSSRENQSITIVVWEKQLFRKRFHMVK